ncbi:MAG: hypothetical protein U0835_25225 [Isosphaeraceae bacterium]
MILAAKARAVLQGRYHAGIADVRHVAKPVLRHRILTTFHAEAEGVDPDRVVDHLIEAVPAPPERAAEAGRRGLTRAVRAGNRCAGRGAPPASPRAAGRRRWPQDRW